MKRLFKKIFLVPLIGASIIFTNISANKSNWSGMNLSPDEISNSEHFQQQRGGNCLSEFKKLEPILNRFISKKIDAAYLNNYLGKPNNIETKNGAIRYQYYLTEKLDGAFVNLTINNYCLDSYKIENTK